MMSGKICNGMLQVVGTSLVYGPDPMFAVVISAGGLYHAVGSAVIQKVAQCALQTANFAKQKVADALNFFEPYSAIIAFT